MLCLGLKKSLLLPRPELMAQGMALCTDVQSQVWYHSAIQAPLSNDTFKMTNEVTVTWTHGPREQRSQTAKMFVVTSLLEKVYSIIWIDELDTLEIMTWP